MLKISYKVLESISGKNRRGRVRRGYCQVCGAKLSDPKSIERGIGKHCLANNVAIILEFVPDNAPNTACTGLATPYAQLSGQAQNANR